MTVGFKFSIAALKARTGNEEFDGQYLTWFLSECIGRIGEGAASLGDMADGNLGFNLNLDGGILIQAVKSIGDVRFYSYALKTCAEWFKDKPVVAKRFAEAEQHIFKKSWEAEGDYKRLNSWYGGAVGDYKTRMSNTECPMCGCSGGWAGADGHQAECRPCGGTGQATGVADSTQT